jgi:hypothetical protein
LAQTIITYMIIGTRNRKTRARDDASVANVWLYCSDGDCRIDHPFGLAVSRLSYMLLGPIILIAGLALYELIAEHRSVGSSPRGFGS